jgi:hypothetical protein
MTKLIVDIENRRKKRIAKKVRLHGLMLLCLYGVKEKKVNDYPQALNSFVDLLTDEIVNKF